MKQSGIVIISILATLGLAGSASADEYSASEDHGRRGIMVGVGLGVGHMSFDCGTDCGGELNESGGGDVHVAYMLTRRLGISAEAWGMVHRSEFDVPLIGVVDITTSQVLATIGPQFWLLPRLWIRGGLGWARGKITSGDTVLHEEQVAGIAASVGFELIRGRNFAVDVQARAGMGLYEDADVSNASIGVGFTWY